jgi:peptide/nickel transport system substrate-binding protein
MRRTVRSRRQIVGASVIAMALVAAACGGSDDEGKAGDKEQATEDSKAAAPDEAAPDATNGAAPTNPPAKVTTAPIPDVKPTVGGKLTVGVEAETTNPWMPAKMQCDVGCQLKIRTVYEPLVAVDEAGEFQPYLAESVTPNADATEWTIKLREGITFHDGEPLNADAAIDNFNRAMNSFLVGKALTYVESTAADGKLTANITKVDDLTYTVKLLKTWWRFPVLALGGQSGFLASPKWLAAADADPTLETQPVGTGPFKYKSFAPGNNFVVEKNPDYWQSDADGVQLPYLDEVEFRIIQDATTRASALRSGEVDIMHTTNGDDLLAFRDNPDEFPMTEATYLGETAYTLLHVGKADSPLNDKRIRCAINAAIDDQTMIDATQAGVVEIANGPFNPSQPGYLEDTGIPMYDPDLAKSLVDEWKAENGGAAPSIIYSATTDQASLTNAEIVVDGLTEAGFDATIAQIEQGKLITNALIGDAGFDAFGWRNHAGFLDNQFIWWHSENALPVGQLALNFGRLSDPKIDELLEVARGSQDPAEIKAAAEEINRIFGSECYIQPSWWTIWGIAHSPSVIGFDQSKFPNSDEPVALGQGFPGSFMLERTFLAEG